MSSDNVHEIQNYVGKIIVDNNNNNTQRTLTTIYTLDLRQKKDQVSNSVKNKLKILKPRSPPPA